MRDPRALAMAVQRVPRGCDEALKALQLHKALVWVSRGNQVIRWASAVAALRRCGRVELARRAVVLICAPRTRMRSTALIHSYKAGQLWVLRLHRNGLPYVYTYIHICFCIYIDTQILKLSNVQTSHIFKI